MKIHTVAIEELKRYRRTLTSAWCQRHQSLTFSLVLTAAMLFTLLLVVITSKTNPVVTIAGILAAMVVSGSMALKQNHRDTQIARCNNAIAMIRGLTRLRRNLLLAEPPTQGVKWFYTVAILNTVHLVSLGVALVVSKRYLDDATVSNWRVLAPVEPKTETTANDSEKSA
jgi:hypothetical protein